jgi:hypothetical protein
MASLEEVVATQLSETREELASANKTLGGLRVLIRCALAEAESHGAVDAANTLKMADQLCGRGSPYGFEAVKFGRI